MSAIHVAIDNSVPQRPVSVPTHEPLMTVRHAAEAMGLRYWLVLRAVKNGDIPTYQLGNGRRRVRLSDIEAAIIASRS